jgi:hypothetical protein
MRKNPDYEEVSKKRLNNNLKKKLVSYGDTVKNTVN